MYDLVKFVPLLPLLGFLFLGLLGNKIKNEKIIGSIGCGTVGIAFVLLFSMFWNFIQAPPESAVIVPIYNWITIDDFNIQIAYQVDQLSLLFGMIITGVGFLIHVYSIGYMHGDRSFFRFFSYLNLFIFMMLNLVLANNFLVTFLGWEGVGLCSYLLIGFWYDKKFQGTRLTWTGDAANKAFITNRVGDYGFLIGMFLVFITFGTLEYTSVNQAASNAYMSYYGSGIMTAITIMFFLGCTGKSAQLPLAIWLPDAMAGPTSVSALIHAATMVTSGIFLIARNSVLFALAPDTMTVVLVVGIITAFTAASVGLVQNDLKKVLAYSTVSQLGFMFAALGAGAFTAGVFHVMTHAFFKGLLFLAAGAIIHGMHDEQNIKKMGGLKSYMPKTYFTFLIATFAISGIPFFSGFFSKDEILWSVYANNGILPWAILAISALFTAFYMFRLLYLVFFGKERFNCEHGKPHEAPATMTIPLIILAFLSAFGGFLGIPDVLGSWASESPNLIHNYLSPIFADANRVLHSHAGHSSHSSILELGLMLVSVLLAVFGIYKAKQYYSDPAWTSPRKLVRNYNGIYRMLLSKYKLDEFYFAVVVDTLLNFSKNFLWKIFDVKGIDGVVNGTAKGTLAFADVARKIQSGIVQNYALLMTAGIVAILCIYIFI
ncbi:MAG: NADH-quinone oxidoreductase subunit L [Candidatus Kapabacteria bacterium]|nr:NADH-quinone oxidoreductase subunit L [Candidatus Kapabacteria bacterium]